MTTTPKDPLRQWSAFFFFTEGLVEILGFFDVFHFFLKNVSQKFQNFFILKLSFAFSQTLSRFIDLR